jgi:hypothetical protein
VLRAIAALVLASATASSNPALVSSSPWWERVTVTISDDGKTQGCKWESSLKPNDTKSCDVVGGDGAKAAAASKKGEYTRITFERRFSPGAKPEAAPLQPGDLLLGSQVMALGIDGQGAVKTCKIVSQEGTMKPEYGCTEASAEHFEASAEKAAAAAQREAYMTIIVYGHSEHVV